MKKIHLLAMLLFTACVVPVSQAQESLFLKDPSTKNKLLQLDLDVGTNFDLAYRGKGNMFTAMSDQKSVFPAISLRLQHFFSRKWGWYTNIRLGIPVKYTQKAKIRKPIGIGETETFFPRRRFKPRTRK